MANPCLTTQFSRNIVLLAHGSTFSAFVYAPCHDCIASQLNGFAWKDGQNVTTEDSPGPMEEIPSKAVVFSCVRCPY